MTARRFLPRRRLLLGAAGAIAAASLGAGAFRTLARARGLAARTGAGLAFGTTVSLTVAAAEAPEAEAALTEAFRAIRAVEAAASLFRADSALSRLNRDGVLQRPDPLLLALLRFALDLAAETGGAFDPTVQPLWTLWAEAAARGGRPDAAALRETLARVGWTRVRIADDAIRLPAGMGLTLNGIVQGFAADRVMAVLEARGIANAFVDTGEFGARGAHPDGVPWRLGIADPREPARIREVIAPFSGFAATSGDYATSFSPDHADHHIFDPATGRSPRSLASVTVTAPTGLLADGLSTTAMVLGERRGRDLVARHPGCAMRVVAKA
ncbi:FAD:protein FMN transferase [Methylobacterium durans]|uniref:FAD:protein FMN transferase n=1 Tax=Methylobacterium durans TaxID=2202825 RepID=A0A2U8W5W3_9HYPH|nr:FAD:protein FMN transferase [Methylobacterium durans]AWN40910.1 FAD:protein FMN transferase [Methylobacterium durans]